MVAFFHLQGKPRSQGENGVRHPLFVWIPHPAFVLASAGQAGCGMNSAKVMEMSRVSSLAQRCELLQYFYGHDTSFKNYEFKKIDRFPITRYYLDHVLVFEP